MTIRREDMVRSILNHMTTHAEFQDKTVPIILDHFEESTTAYDAWYEPHLVSFIPDSTRRNDQIERGTFRVVCRTRKQPIEKSHVVPLTKPYEQADAVQTAFRGVDIEVRDWTENGGSTVLGYASFDEVQVDDVGDAEDGVHVLICSTTFILTAAVAA